MKIFEMTTGLIAAVVVALGANHYVNNNTPVGEEPVVKEQVVLEHQPVLLKPKRDCVWYLYIGAKLTHTDYNDHIEDHEKYVLFSSNPNDTPGCEDEEQICAICLPNSGNTHPAEGDFNQILDEIRDGNTVEDLIMLKAVPDDN